MSSMLYPEWAFAPDRLILPKQEIHLWRASLNPSPSKLRILAQTLSTDELQRAERFRFEHDRHRFITGRGTLRAILGRYLEIEPQQIQFCYAASGKPAIAPAVTNFPTPHSPLPTPPIEFNLSHSQELMVCAVTRDDPSGIDLEYLRPVSDLEGLTQRFFSPQEHLAIQRLPVEQRARSFFQYWTCKEALLKATGEGLADLNQIEVAIVDEQVRLIRWAEKADATEQWLLNLFVPAPDYIAALAVNVSLAAQQEPHQVVFMHWQNEEGEG